MLSEKERNEPQRAYHTVPRPLAASLHGVRARNASDRRATIQAPKKTLPTLDHARLDDPIWSALTSDHARFAVGTPRATRYPADIGPLAAFSEDAPGAGLELRNLVDPSGPIVLFGPHVITPPSGLDVERRVTMHQMVATQVPRHATGDASILPLGTADADDMLRLALLTKPGPFAPRTHELGRFVGIRVNGDLVAMAGERLRFTPYVEISAVCVHPEHRHHGYARRLLIAVVERAMREGLVPFLHVVTDNTGAVALYRQLHFEARRQLYATILSVHRREPG
jgi:predicted GNAT family acetyltransferase